MKSNINNIINYLESLIGEVEEVKEGLIRLIIPNLAKYVQGKRIEPRWAPVFYKPLTVPSRDIDTLVVEAYRNLYNSKIRLCDLLSATGVRGLRYLIESGVEQVVLNDVDKRAYELIKVNVMLNEVESKATLYNLEANLLLNSLKWKGYKFDVIDIDPFGTPIPFLDATFRVIKNGGMVSVTATDLAPLLGAKANACLRKYQAISIKTPFSREIAVRILVGYICRQAAKYELAITPLFSYSLSHIVRVHIIVKRGARRADKALKELGYACYCEKCGYRGLVRSYPMISFSECPVCSHQLLKIGPLWVGSLWKLDFIDEVRRIYKERAYLHNESLSNVLRIIHKESRAPPLYYSVKEFSRVLRVREVSLSELVSRLRSKGFFASRTHFDPKGFKTDAMINFIKNLVLSIVKGDCHA